MHLHRVITIFICIYLLLLLFLSIPNHRNFTHLQIPITSNSISENLHQPSQHETVAARMRERELRVKETCRGMEEGNDSSALDIMYYAPSRNLFVCATPKAGSSTWLFHLLHMEGIHPRKEEFHFIHHEYSARMRASKHLGETQAIKQLSNTSAVLTVRHPLARLVSVYRDKFDGGELKELHLPAQYRYFWLPAMKALNRSTTPPLHLSFPDFIHFATHHFPREPHWRPLSQTCSPCRIHYQFVMMLETFVEDLQFIAADLNITTIDFDVRINKKSNGAKDGMEPKDFLSLDRDSLVYFLNLPITLLRKVLRVYALDFDMFGYTIPDELKARAELKDLKYEKGEFL